MNRLENDNALLRAAIRADRTEWTIKMITVLALVAICITGAFFTLTNWRFI